MMTCALQSTDTHYFSTTHVQVMELTQKCGTVNKQSEKALSRGILVDV